MPALMLQDSARRAHWLPPLEQRLTQLAEQPWEQLHWREWEEQRQRLVRMLKPKGLRQRP